MSTILEYLDKYGDYSFREMPFTEVDSLILCQLSYLKFDGMVPDVKENAASVTLESLQKRDDFDRLFADVRFEKRNKELIARLLQGQRFRNLKLNCFYNMIEKEWEIQFAAVTFILDTGVVYVAFRGTDESIVGWKEDFNMAFMAAVPSQELSVRYLNTVASKIHSNFYVGGHSKGGNLAVYSAMNCQPAFQDRILRIYSMDGPGFRPEVLDRCKYDMISGRVLKLLPYSSLIGMIFESDNSYEVVVSSSAGGGLAQHDPSTWVVEDDHLKRMNQLKRSSRRTDKTLNKWILSLEEEQRKTFIDTLYQVVLATEADNLIDLSVEWRKSVNSILGAMKGLDPETSAALKSTVKALFEIAGADMKEEVARNSRAAWDTTKKYVSRGRAFLSALTHHDKDDDK